MEGIGTKPFYEVIQTAKISEEFGTYSCFGVKMSHNGKNVCVEDVALRPEGLERLVKLCNELELSPIHLNDVIEDFLQSGF